MSADGARWFLLNVSPDIGAQVAAFPPLGPPDGASRGTGVAGVLLTNADLDHTLGLFQLREGPRLTVHANKSTSDALDRGLRMGNALAGYCGIDWNEPPLVVPVSADPWADAAELRPRDGTPSGLRVAAFELPGNAPRYLGTTEEPAGHVGVGYRIADETTGGVLIFVPDLAAWEDDFASLWAGASLLLIDGTFWSDDEMAEMGVGATRASVMGHLPVGGEGGTLARLRGLDIARKVYLHINNTNPILREDSPERAAVDAAGILVGEDGMEFEV